MKIIIARVRRSRRIWRNSLTIIAHIGALLSWLPLSPGAADPPRAFPSAGPTSPAGRVFAFGWPTNSTLDEFYAR
jgi:hypothetical protein